ncbi:MAG: metallophosphoesterase family protein, partial [Deferribacteraceae bacterium]|nr:metallophosphoesterase family protein [Deferribacteraceae bacterium]
PDIIVYGHTHKNELYDQLKPVILNPGSPTRARGGFNSYAVLETGGGDFTIDIIKLKGVFL